MNIYAQSGPLGKGEGVQKTHSRNGFSVKTNYPWIIAPLSILFYFAVRMKICLKYPFLYLSTTAVLKQSKMKISFVTESAFGIYPGLRIYFSP